jgi:hypothetical protein
MPYESGEVKESRVSVQSLRARWMRLGRRGHLAVIPSCRKIPLQMDTLVS